MISNNVSRINLWHQFEVAEAKAHNKLPEGNKENCLTMLKAIVELGEAAGTLTSKDIYDMNQIILSLI